MKIISIKYFRIIEEDSPELLGGLEDNYSNEDDDDINPFIVPRPYNTDNLDTHPSMDPLNSLEDQLVIYEQPQNETASDTDAQVAGGTVADDGSIVADDTTAASENGDENETK